MTDEERENTGWEYQEELSIISLFIYSKILITASAMSL